MAADLYLPDDCWKYVFRFLINDDGNNSLSLVSKQFLSITNHLRLHLSLTICHPTHSFLLHLFQRFPNLTSLHVPRSRGDRFCWISLIASSIRMKFTQINNVENFVVSTKLASLRLACNSCLRDESITMFVSIFPNLHFLDLRNCSGISEGGICQVLMTCSNIRHLNLARCSRVKLLRMNFEVPKLEVLDLSETRVDDEALYEISKSCRGLLRLILEYCSDVTPIGVRHVVKNCTQLTVINLEGCHEVCGFPELYFKLYFQGRL